MSQTSVRSVTSVADSEEEEEWSTFMSSFLPDVLSVPLWLCGVKFLSSSRPLDAKEFRVSSGLGHAPRAPRAVRLRTEPELQHPAGHDLGVRNPRPVERLAVKRHRLHVDITGGRSAGIHRERFAVFQMDRGVVELRAAERVHR